jgi:hypothetical protein
MIRQEKGQKTEILSCFSNAERLLKNYTKATKILMTFLLTSKKHFSYYGA